MTEQVQIALLSVLLLVVATGQGRAAVTRVKTPADVTFKKQWNRVDFNHKLFDTLLKTHVSNGKVDYQGIRKRSMGLLLEYLFRIAKTDAGKLKDRAARFAFFINAYNAVTIKAVLDRLPAEKSAWKQFSVAKVKGFWKKYAYEVGGKFLTLDQLEHQIMRPVFKDPRLHFAIVCASIGCPTLHNRAYQPKTLDQMLRAATKRFLVSRRAFRLDRGSKTVYLSALFNWFKSDFRQKPYGHELLFVAKFLSDNRTAEYLKLNRSSLTLRYLKYDWGLNHR